MHFTKNDLERYHAAAKLIEADGLDAIQSCVQRFGREIAGTLIVAFLRNCEGSLNSWPALEHVVPNVNETLKNRGLIID